MEPLFFKTQNPERKGKDLNDNEKHSCSVRGCYKEL